MTDEEVEKIIKRNMNLQMNLAGIRADFEEATRRAWVELSPEEVLEVANTELSPKSFARGAAWANAKLKEKNT